MARLNSSTRLSAILFASRAQTSCCRRSSISPSSCCCWHLTCTRRRSFSAWTASLWLFCSMRSLLRSCSLDSTHSSLSVRASAATASSTSASRVVFRTSFSLATLLESIASLPTISTLASWTSVLACDVCALRLLIVSANSCLTSCLSSSLYICWMSCALSCAVGSLYCWSSKSVRLPTSSSASLLTLPLAAMLPSMLGASSSSMHERRDWLLLLPLPLPASGVAH
mmetsp:Transcript_65429/g.202850  ORF Transcript_65429/g.202850 Transcript_65429/m.202850 type:complete len:226 (-) Transcript_65429:193-870(-)